MLPPRKSQKSNPLVDRVIRHVDRMIGKGELRPGQRIMESEISARLNVGRVPVREAIRFLAGAGIAELVPNSGARVRIFTARDVIEMLVLQNGLMVLAAEILMDQQAYDETLEKLERVSNRIAALPSSTSSIMITRLLGRYQWHILKDCGNSALMQIAQNGRFNHYRLYLTELAEHSVFVDAAARFPLMTAALRDRDLGRFKELADEQVKRFRANVVQP